MRERSRRRSTALDSTACCGGARRSDGNSERGGLRALESGNGYTAARHLFGAGLDGKQVCRRNLLEEMGFPVASADSPDAPLIGIVSRFAGQKGFDLLAQIADELFQATGALDGVRLVPLVLLILVVSSFELLLSRTEVSA